MNTPWEVWLSWWLQAMAEIPLAPSALQHLGEVLDRYERAPLGRLNDTAAELERVCRQLGWTRFSGIGTPVGARVWARAQLGLDQEDGIKPRRGDAGP